ncbi:unnamed protein product [Mucor hiemalis]
MHRNFWTTIAKELLQVFLLFGFAKVVSTDSGAESKNSILKDVLAECGIDQRLSTPYNPKSNSTNESFYSRLHKSRPFEVVFNRQANQCKDYSYVDPDITKKSINAKNLQLKLEQVTNIIIPTLREQIIKTQKADNAYFIKTHKIRHEPIPIGAEVMINNVSKRSKMDEDYEGPFTVHNIVKPGCYVLTDKTGEIISRNIPTSHIQVVSSDKVKSFDLDKQDEVEAIVDHHGRHPTNCEYKVRWKGYAPEHDTWEPTESFNQPDSIVKYWHRRKANAESSILIISILHFLSS